MGIVVRTIWLVLLFMHSVVVAAPAVAESPAEITARLIEEISSKQKLNPAFDYVDWDGAYAAMEPEQRAYLGIKSVKEFRAYEIEKYDGQDVKVGGGLEAALGKAGPAELPRLRQMQEHLTKSVEDQRERALKAFEETTYTVGEISDEGDGSRVPLVKERGELVINDVVEFVNVGGKWRIKSAAPFNPMSGEPAKEQRRSLLGPPLAAPGEGLVRPF